MKKILFISAFLIAAFNLNAQDGDSPTYVSRTFNSEKAVNAQTVEQLRGGSMNMIIQHRFGTINGGIREFFGLDAATIRIGLDYGITDWLMIGAARSKLNKTYDAYVKAQLLKQSTSGGSPVSLSWYSGYAAETIDEATDDRPLKFVDRLSFYNQLLIASKLSDRFSIQIMPTHVHRNLVPFPSDDNDVFALGGIGRARLTHHLTLNLEYSYVLSSATADQTNNSFSVGFDIETSGHMFQLHLTNSSGMTENFYVAENLGDWSKGDIMIGFNVVRVFNVCGRKRK